tara:strand:+ start:3445 stop:3831 length:387 start_codon:yes stop_codon:yes gene_type:complete
MSEDKPDIFAAKHTTRDIDDRIDAEMSEVSKYAIQTDDRLAELESEVKYLMGENTRMTEQLHNHYVILQELGVLKDDWDNSIANLRNRVDSLGEDGSANKLSGAVAEIQEEIRKMTDGKTWFVNEVRQ